MENSASSSHKVTPVPYGEFCPGGLNSEPSIPPNDPTIGYKFNHTMIRVRDIKESLKFYVDLMGMRTVFS
jgi:lactoylglutathione lyase